VTKLIFIAGGGAAGSVLRYLVAGWGQRLTPGAFPMGTLLVNLSGCLLIGYVGAALAGPVIVRDEYRLAVLVGLFGGFTTFSTFGYETFGLLAERDWARAALNLALSNGLGIVGVWIGYRLAERLHGG
jgi:fluoride exporter